jgi:hypothetical protein
MSLLVQKKKKNPGSQEKMKDTAKGLGCGSSGRELSLQVGDPEFKLLCFQKKKRERSSSSPVFKFQDHQK